MPGTAGIVWLAVVPSTFLYFDGHSPSNHKQGRKASTVGVAVNNKRHPWIKTLKLDNEFLNLMPGN